MPAQNDSPPTELRSSNGGRAGIRRPDRTDAILAATYELLSEVGYDRLTIDAVAARARASKATIYQRWPGKRELVVDAFRRDGAAPFRPSQPGASLVADLTQFLDATREVSGNDDARAFLSLLAASQQDPAIADALLGSLVEPRRACRLIIERAVQRGELVALDPDVGAARILELVMGQAIVQQLVLRAPIDDVFGRELVVNVLVPTLQWMARAQHQG